MDDVQIGGGSGAQMGKSSAETADNSGPLEKRIVSKNWSVRAGAYEELTKLCTDGPEKSKADHFNQHCSEWKTYLKDSNPGALEKALNCLEIFLDKIHPSILVPNQNDMINMLVEKCLGHAKPVIKKKAEDCLLLIFEVGENFDESIDTLSALIKHKNIKVLQSGTSAVALLVEQFGVKKVKIPDFAKQMLANAQHTNPAVKNAAYDFYKAVYKWIADAILPQIEDKLKPIQIEELKKAFGEVKEKNDKTKRLTRSEKKEAEENQKNAAIDAAMAEETKVEEVIDPLEFAPVVDVISKFDGEWQDTTAAIKKWDEKKAKIDELITACTNVKIKPANTDSLTKFLKKEIGNSNINIVMVALKAGTALEIGMKKDFAAGVKDLIGAVLTKFKEKRPMVIADIQAFLDASMACTSLEAVAEEVIPKINDTAPGVKSGTIKFVEASCQITYIDVLQRISNELLPAMVKVMDDKDGGVRDLALHCMGILKGRLGESVMSKFLKDVNAQKLAKIEEAAKEVKPSKYDRAENWKPPPPKKVVPKKEENDDALMTFDDDKPKKKPPPNIGKKPVSKKKPVDEDAEMINESPAPPKKAPPALSSAKPKAACAPSKGPSGPVIVEEDLGQGLSKEEAIEKVQEFFDSSTVKKFEEAKWQTKLEGFNELQEQIKEKQPPAQILEAVAQFVKAKMKDWKESNINLQKAIPALFDCIATSCTSMNKRTFSCPMSFFVDKIGDVKLSQLIKDMLMNATECLGPKFIGLQVIKYAATAKAPNNLKEACFFLTQMIDEFGISGTPLKETIDYAKLATAHATPAVRQAAMKLFCEIYQHVGDVIRNFMADIKESTLKMIDAELNKITPYKKGEHQKKRQYGAAEEAAAGGKPGKKAAEEDPFGDLPREDISKKLNSKLMEQFKHKDWKIRKKAGDDVEAILREAKMRIEPNGLTDLMGAMKNGMKDPNKAVVKVYIVLLGLLAEAIGAQIKQFAKKCFVPMLANLSDKQSLVRESVIATTNKWSDAIGAESIINYLAQVIVTENPELRTEGLKWITENKDCIKDADTKEMIKPFIACLTDKSKAIRESSEALISILMPIVGYQAFMTNTKDFLPAVQQTLKPILEKIKNSSGAGQNAGDGGAPAAPAAPSKKAQPVEEEKAPVQNSFAKKAVEVKEKEKEKKREPSKSPPPEKRQPTSKAAAAAAAAAEDEIIIKVLNKKKREQLDLRSKYPLNEVKGDHIEKLQSQCQDAFGLKFHDQMFAKAQDFKKHIECVQQFDKFIKSQADSMIEINDILFKWCNLRMMESSNTQLYVAIFDFYANLITMFIETDYQCAEFEMVVLLGTLCDKTGVNNKTLQDKVRKLIRMCYEVYDKKACFRLIIDTGVKNKNLKAVAECLDEIADYITQNGVDHVTKKDFQLFIVMADNKDKGVRENALKVFAEAYTVLGEQIWTLLKDIPLKVKGLLEQRFKQVAKKTGGLAQSINSARGGLKGLQNSQLEMSQGGIKQKRMTIAPGLNGSLGGMKSLQFNKSAVKNEDSSMNKSIPQQSDSEKQSLGSSINAKMEKLDFNKEEVPLQKPVEDQPMEDATNTHMQEIFQGKAMQPQEDVDMVDPQAEEEDMVAQPTPSKIGLQRPTKTTTTVPAQRVAQNNFVMDEDGDEIQRMLREAENNLDLDPALRDQKLFILGHIQQLRDGDLLKRVDSLVALNEVISTTSSTTGGDQPAQSQELKNQQKALIHCCNDLINAFTHVMNDIFRHPVQDIPLRFTKYFITIVHKTCTSKEIMTEVSEKSVHDLVEQLLTRLLIDNLDKIGQNKEGELILKNLNSSMIRMLENCNHTYIFGVLFGLLKKFQNDDSLPKMHGLIIKCLLKLNKIMDKLIEKLDMPKFLVSIHEYLVIIDHNNRSQNDDLGIRIVKTLINEIVKLKGESIWQSYTVIENHPSPDNHIKKWIQIIIKSLQLNNPSSGQTRQSSQGPEPVQGGSKMVVEYEFKKILQDLRDPTKYENGIARLDKFTKNNPHYDYKDKLDRESEQFSKKVISSLTQAKNGNSWKSTSNSDSLGGKANQEPVRKLHQAASSSNLGAIGGLQKGAPSQDLNRSLNQMSAFESKMAKFKRTSNLPQPTTYRAGQEEVNQSRQSNAGLNTSFSAMNQNISQKWAQISNSSKKVGGLTGRATMNNAALSQTINTGGTNPLNTSNNKFQSKVQGSFASRIQMNKMGNNDSIGAQAKQENPQPKQGISSNSFRSRLQGLGSAQAAQQPISSNTQVPNTSNAGTAAASSQDLQKRLDQMKAKMQALKKQ